MSNGKLLTLFLDHENELRATMPDFAHQMSELLQVPPKVVDYSKKAVAEYEIAETELETTSQESEEEFGFHEDFEQNIMFLMDKSDAMLASVFKNRFNHDANRDTMIAQLSNDFSTEDLKNYFKSAESSDLLSTFINKCGVEPKKKQKNNQLMESEVDADIKTYCGVDKKKKKKELIEIKFCESCDADHADHFRLCDLCNEEHDGCCEVYA